MTTPTEAVYSVLSAFAGVQALVGNGDSPETYRIHAILMPQDSSMPAITFQRVSDERINTMSDAGGNGVVRDRIRITSWAKSIAETQALAEQIRLAMKAATTFESLQVFETDDFESDTLYYSTISDYSVWYHY
jgi:hypothetical protein